MSQPGSLQSFTCPPGSRFAGQQYSCHGGTYGCTDNNSDCCNGDGSAPRCPSSVSPRPRGILQMDICLKIEEDACDVIAAACAAHPDSALCPKLQSMCQNL